MPPSLYSSPRSRSYTNISHTTTKKSVDDEKDILYPANNTSTLPLPPKHKRRGNLPPLHRAPSQVTMTYTTVPQAMVSTHLVTRHQPTRTSLRHSRNIGSKNRTELVYNRRLGYLVTFLGFVQVVLGMVLSLAAIVHLVLYTWPVHLDWPLASGPVVSYHLYCSQWYRQSDSGAFCQLSSVIIWEGGGWGSALPSLVLWSMGTQVA